MEISQSVLDIDTSVVQTLPVLHQITNKRKVEPTLGSPYCNVFGYAAAHGTHNTSGPCALACILDYYRIGWSHIPKTSDGHNDNEQFVREIMKWSKTPDLQEGTWGSSPQRIQDSLNRAGLQATWYANGNEQDTLHFLKQELLQGHPVIVLLNYSNDKESFAMSWQVLFQIDEHLIYTKTNTSRNRTVQWTHQEFINMMQNDIPSLNRTLITTRKPTH